MTQKIDVEKTHVQWEYAHKRPLTACCWDPKDRFVYFGSEENGIHRVDLQSKVAVPMVGTHDSWVRAIGTSPDGQFVYSGGYDGRLLWWPAADETPQPIRALDAHQGWIRALAVSPDGRQIATCGNDLSVKLWDSDSGSLIRSFAGHQWHVYNVAFSPSGDTLVSCDLRGYVKFWNPILTAGDSQANATSTPSDAPETVDPELTGLVREIAQVEVLYKYDTTFRADIGGARCMDFARDGKQLAIGGVTNVTNAFAGVGDTVIVLVDVAEGKIALQLSVKEKVRGTAWGVAQHPDGFWVGLAAGGGGGWLYFWHADKAEEFFKLKLKSDGRGMALSPDTARIAVAHADSQLRIYGLYAEPATS